MKMKRIIALLLVCLMLLGCSTAVLAAPRRFTDLDPDDPAAWYASYILDLADKGIFEGDAAGTVRPLDPVTNMEALTMAARMAVPDKSTRDQFWADRAELLTAMFPKEESGWWFFREAATCLELGIISSADLTFMAQTGALTQHTTKAEYAMYVVRAMGLEDLVRGSAAVSLPFVDDVEIPNALRPYVDLLYNYGVITGTSTDPAQNYFYPQKVLTRGECATFLSKALSEVDKRGISVEIPRFTKYAWKAGYVKSVDVDDGGARLLTLEPSFGEAFTVTLPSGVAVYRANQPVGAIALQTGVFARVCYNEAGTAVESVRVTPKDLLQSVSGSCDSLTAKEIVVKGVRYAIDRFTQVSAGAKTGDASIIDFDAGYTDAALTADAGGRVLHLALTGGTRQLTGILTDVAVTATAGGSKTAITVTSYGGKTTVYPIPDDAVITADSAAAALKESFEGRHVTLRVDEVDLTTVRSVDVNVTDKYIQGIVRSVNTRTSPNKVEITETGSTRQYPYEIGQDAVILYSEAAAQLSAIPTNVYFTAKVEGGNIITWMSAYPSYQTVSGAVASISYTDPTVIQVTPKDGGGALTFSIPVAKLGSLKITLDGKTATVFQLRTGQQAEVTLLYNEVTQIDAISQQANVSGVLDALTQKRDGVTELTILFSDGSTAVYTATSATTVSRDGAAVSLNTIPIGSQVSLLTDGTTVLDLKATGVVQTKDQLTGTVYTIDTASRTLYLLVPGMQAPQLIEVPSGSLSILDTATGKTLSTLSSLKPGDLLRVYGSYNAKGAFAATSLVREAAAG